MTKAETTEDKLTKRAEELMAQLTNKDKREAVKFFDANYEDLDGMDQMVLLAHVADRSKSIEELDAAPMNDLQRIILGE